jgi:DNA-binding NarL/FixJ family response regulator
MNKTPLRFLLIDDFAVVRAGMRQILGSKFGAEFIEAGNAAEALQAAQPGKLDLIVLDVSMPGRSGLDIIADLRKAQPQSPILVLSMHGEVQFAARALRAGAAGYIMKSSVPTELLKAADKVLAGGHYVSESFAEALAGTMQMGRKFPAHEDLSAREFEVLRLLATGKSGKEIAEALSISFKTVSTYRTRLLQKLNLRTNSDLFRYAIREGMISSASV